MHASDHAVILAAPGQVIACWRLRVPASHAPARMHSLPLPTAHDRRTRG